VRKGIDLLNLEDEYSTTYQNIRLEPSQTGAFAFIKLDFINKYSSQPVLKEMLINNAEDCLSKCEELADSFITELLKNHSREIAILSNVVNENRDLLKKILSIALVIVITRI
jgi:hypothetical protein